MIYVSNLLFNRRVLLIFLLAACDRKPKFKKKPCRQWFEVSDDNLENVTISSQSTKDNIKAVKKGKYIIIK